MKLIARVSFPIFTMGVFFLALLSSTQQLFVQFSPILLQAWLPVLRARELLLLLLVRMLSSALVLLAAPVLLPLLLQALLPALLLLPTLLLLLLLAGVLHPSCLMNHLA